MTGTAGRRKSDLRTGYTTGACAAAAAKAAALALKTQKQVNEVEITLPSGHVATFRVDRCAFDSIQSQCSITKDAGDDPDVTHGAEIDATVRRVEAPGLAILRGEGVGLVTKPGLGLEVASPAINPGPRMLITRSVQEVFGQEPATGGIEITISVPRGAELAKRTLNERLGIVGGISILGTSGVVRPFSTAAYKTCIVQALNVAKASGCARVALTTGGRTEKFAQALLPLPQEAFIQMGDFVGFTLRRCAARDLRDIAIVAMIGKLSKIAAGDFQTHVSRSRVNADFLAEVASACGVSASTLDRIRASNTARHFSEILPESTAERVFTRLCELASTRCSEHAGGGLGVESLLVGFDGQLLGRARVDA